MKKLLVALLVLWSSFAHADALDDLLSESVVKLYHDYRAGHLQDLSGNANHGTGTDIAWTGDGVGFPASTSMITVADSAELRLTEGSLVVYSKSGFQSQTDDEGLFCKYDAGGTNYFSYLYSTPRVYFNDGANGRRVNTDVTGHNCIGINFKSGEACEGFTDGVSVGAFNDTNTVTADDADLIIGNNYLGAMQLKSALSAALIINRELTNTEMAQVCAALQSYRHPKMTSAQAQGSYGVELVSNGDLEIGATTGWMAYRSAVLTAEAGNALDGNYVLRVAIAADYAYARQSIMTAGKTYHVTGHARGDGTSPPSIRDDGAAFWTGTTSTTWQVVDVVHAAASSHLDLFKTVNGGAYTEYDNISVTEIESDHVQFKTDWGVTASNTNITGGNIEGTPIWVSTGTWKVSTDTIDGQTVKVLENVAAGIAYLDASEIEGSPTLDARGTVEVWVSKADASSPYIGIIADTVGAYNAAGQDAYWLGMDNDEKVQVGESTNGSWSLKFNTAASYISHSTWNRYTVTISDAGIFTTYVDGTEVDESGGSGSNPFTDTTTTTSYYIVLDLDAGDKIALSGPTGDQCLWKKQGVIAP